MSYSIRKFLARDTYENWMLGDEVNLEDVWHHSRMEVYCARSIYYITRCARLYTRPMLTAHILYIRTTFCRRGFLVELLCGHDRSIISSDRASQTLFYYIFVRYTCDLSVCIFDVSLKSLYHSLLLFFIKRFF